MQPKSTQALDPAAFRRVVDKISSASTVKRQIALNSGYASPLPEEIGLQLTHRCNLRCAHCFQWNDTGFHQGMNSQELKEELSIDVIAKLLQQTKDSAKQLYLWGGEPMVYRHWDALAELMAQDQRWTVLCTNGVTVERRLQSLIKMSRNLVCMMSLDGFETENDKVRGSGTFQKVMGAVECLTELRMKGIYKGEVSIGAVLNNELVPRLLDFVEFFEHKNINSLYLVFPWYIHETSATRMDQYVAEHFAWLDGRMAAPRPGHQASWHSYQYHLDPALHGQLKETIRLIRQRTWKLRVRFQPDVDDDEMDAFLNGSEQPAQRRQRCLSVITRLNVLPNGDVTTCKLFPEFTIGNLNQADVEQIWHGEQARRARAEFSKGLTPVCSKCVQLYMHGV